MALAFKRGQAVTISGTTLSGIVRAADVVEDDVVYSVNYTDKNGPQQRFFKESELEAEVATDSPPETDKTAE